MNPEINFTGIEPIIDWLEQSGLLDAISNAIAEFSVESLIALVTLVLAAIGGLAIGGIILAVLAVVVIAVAMIAIAAYLMRGIGLSKIAKKLGVKHRFLAWIPYARTYLLGKCAEQSMMRNGKKAWKWGRILLCTTIGLGIGLPIVQASILFLLSSHPVISVLVALLLECSSLILLFMTGRCLLSICKEFMGNVLAVILAILAPLSGLVAVLLFVVGFLKTNAVRAAEEAEANNYKIYM